MGKEWGEQTPGEREQARRLAAQRRAKRQAAGRDPNGGCGTSAAAMVATVAWAVWMVRRTR